MSEESNAYKSSRIVLPKEGVEINNSSDGVYENIFTEEKYISEKASVDSYDALNASFMTIDEIREDFSRLSDSQDIMILQKELQKLMPNFEIPITGVIDKVTEKALEHYDSLLQSI